jgi:hypothetical protein
MKEFPNCVSASKSGNFVELKKHRDLCYLRDDIYEFLLKTEGKNFEKEFFDFTSFFDKNSIPSECRIEYKDKIIKELKEKNWHIATAFGGWGLVLAPTEELLSKSIWKSSLDFTVIS